MNGDPPIKSTWSTSTEENHDGSEGGLGVKPASAETVPWPDESQKATTTTLDGTRRTDTASGSLEENAESPSELENAETASPSEGHKENASTTLNGTHQTPVASSGYEENEEAWDESECVETAPLSDEPEVGNPTALDRTSQTGLVSSGYGEEVEVSSELDNFETAAAFQGRNEDIATTLNEMRQASIASCRFEQDDEWYDSDGEKTGSWYRELKESIRKAVNGTEDDVVSCFCEKDEFWYELENFEEAPFSEEPKESVITNRNEARQAPVASCSYEEDKETLLQPKSNGGDAGYQVDDAEDEEEGDLATTQVVGEGCGASRVRPASPISFHRRLKNTDLNEITLPPMPEAKCSPKLEQKFALFHELQLRKGWDINTFIQSHKGYRNPSYYAELVKYCEMDEWGTNYPPEMGSEPVWGPESYYDALALRQEEDMACRCPCSSNPDVKCRCGAPRKHRSRKRRKRKSSLPPTPSTPPQAPAWSTSSSENSLTAEMTDGAVQ
ncbi:hypothetical protein V5799_032293 [Amblyomma americanum]|uniref:Uncharacterized protein n=1 Tax=Amblyomma americanum TaxID=6943 RepID=A0AAQ4DRL1_AMBAM